MFKLEPAVCDICYHTGDLFYLDTGSGYDTMPKGLDPDGGRRRTIMCKPCGDFLVEEALERVIPFLEKKVILSSN